MTSPTATNPESSHPETGLVSACPDRTAIQAYLNGDAVSGSVDLVVEHLDRCVACQAIADSLNSKGRSKRERSWFQGLADRPFEVPLHQGKLDLTQILSADKSAEQVGGPITARPGDEFVVRPGQIDHDQSKLPLAERFTIFEALGVGAFATVFRAQDKLLGRIVALKIAHLPVSVLPEASRRRFVTELRASAALNHPNIVPVFDAGLDQQQFYLVSEYIAGMTLTDWLDKTPHLLAPALVAEIVAQLADAVQHAHETGILHRDLKPSNILVDPTHSSGSLPFTPKVTDFGLARFHEADVTITQDGTVLGSPLYMSPEQAQGRNSEMGPASDVYALGVILYQLLTRKTPINGSNSIGLLHSVVHDDPVPLRHYRSDVPRDLEAICWHCLEKESTHRYPNARALVTDLREFVEGHAVAVRLPTLAERLRRWTKRHPAWAGLIASIVIGVSVVVALLARHSQTVAELNTDLSQSNTSLAKSNDLLLAALEQSQAAKQRAEVEERHALETVYAYDIGRAFEAWRKWDALEVQAIVSRYAEVGADSSNSNGVTLSSLRGPEWHWLNRQFRCQSRAITHLPRAVYRMAIAPNGRQLAVAGRDDLVRIVDLASGETAAEWTAQQTEVNGLAFSPDGQTLWTAGDDGTIKAWNVATRTETLRFVAHPEHMTFEVIYDPRRDMLITCGNEPVIRLWNARTGESLGTLTGHTNSIDVIVLHPDGRRLFSGSTDFSVRVWDLESKTGESLTSRIHEKVSALAISPDGHWLAAGMTDGQLLVWDFERNVPRINWNLKDAVSRVRFDAFNQRIFVGDANGFTWEWPIPQTDQKQREPPPPTNVWPNDGLQPYDLQLSPDGSELLTASRSGGVRAFKLSPPTAYDFTLSFQRVRDFLCLSNNRLVVAEDHRIAIVDYLTAPNQPRVLDESATWQAIAASHDGTVLAARSSEGDIGVWRLPSGERVVRRASDSAGVYPDFSLTPDGRWLALANHKNGKVELIDTQTGQQARQLDAQSCSHAMFSPNGQLLAYDVFRSEEPHRVLKLVDWPSGTLRTITPCPSVYYGSQSLSPDGQLLALATERVAEIYDTQSGKRIHALFGHRGDIRHLSFSPDSRRLVTAGADECVKLWHVPTGQYLLEFPTLKRRPADFCRFTTDGRWLAYTVSGDSIRFVRLLDD